MLVLKHEQQGKAEDETDNSTSSHRHSGSHSVCSCSLYDRRFRRSHGVQEVPADPYSDAHPNSYTHFYTHQLSDCHQHGWKHLGSGANPHSHFYTYQFTNGYRHGRKHLGSGADPYSNSHQFPDYYWHCCQYLYS